MSDRGELPFSDFQTVNKRSKDRPIALFAGGEIATKTVRKLRKNIHYIFDNSPNMWGHIEHQITIQNPSEIPRLKDRPYFLICTTSFVEVAEQLQSLGLKPNEDFLVSPILNDLRIIDELESLQTQLVFSSGSPPLDSPTGGGGLYRVTVDGLDYEYQKVYSGSCHSIMNVGDSVYTVDDERGLVQFDRDFNVLQYAELPPGSRGHGLSYDKNSDTFFIACSYLDKVLRLDKDFNIIQEYHLSFKADTEEAPMHHTNDCLVLGNSLYVSMFSATGNWKRDIFDGAVVEFNLETGEKNGVAIADLWMPHNIAYIDGSLTVCDSLRGNLLRNNAQVAGHFAGFTRGLDYDGVYFYIGQSRNRNFSKNLGISNNTSIDTSIIVFDEVTKVSRTLHMPSSISEIHGILCLDQ